MRKLGQIRADGSHYSVNNVRIDDLLGPNGVSSQFEPQILWLIFGECPAHPAGAASGEHPTGNVDASLLHSN